MRAPSPSHEQTSGLGWFGGHQMNETSPKPPVVQKPAPLHLRAMLFAMADAGGKTNEPWELW